MTALEQALIGLRQAVDSPRRHHMWRWLVRHRMAGLKEALSAPHTRASDAWLAARELTLERDRQSLLRRLAELAPQVTSAHDVEPVRHELHRLIADADRHRQRLSDLVYDAVALELGGSE